MLREYIKRINMGIGIGFALQLIAVLITSKKLTHSIGVMVFGLIIGLLGMALFIYGLCMYAKAKGWHWAWGVLGLLGLLGLLILACFKDLTKISAIDKTKSE